MSRRLGVVLAGVSSPGYRSLALDYLQASVAADARLDTALMRFDFDITTDPWWIAYRVLQLRPAPDVVALPVLCWTARVVYEAARVIKAASPDTLIVVGGPEVGPIADQVLAEQPHIDAVVRAEGEQAFCDLLHSYSRGGDWAATPGVTARDGSGIVRGPDRPVIDDMDSIASPFAGRAHATDGSAYVETYRGCPHRCSYCYEGKGSTRIRSFSWDRIRSDIDAVASTPGMQAFSFIDPVFNLTGDRLGRLADIMEPHVQRGVRLHTIEVDIERIDTEQAEQLVRAGVVSVETGPQSIGATALKNCRRELDLDRFASGVEACRAAGISVECDLIVGLPGDTFSDVISGIEFVVNLDPGKVQMSTLHVLPGTELWENAAEFGIVFDAQPPHELIQTAQLSFNDLRRLEVLGKAIVDTYAARLTIPPRRQ